MIDLWYLFIIRIKYVYEKHKMQKNFDAAIGLILLLYHTIKDFSEGYLVLKEINVYIYI